MPYTALQLETREHIARITLNRPASANALDATLAGELNRAVAEVGTDPQMRAVILTGAGGAFCSGGDLKSFAAALARADERLRDVLDGLHAAVLGLAHLHVPTIAAVRGVAAGAGLSLACACDLVLAGESARFTVAYTRAGLTPDGSCTYFLPRRIGTGRALELILTNRVLAAREAEAWGLVTRVAPDAEVATAADDLAARLAAGAPLAQAGAKRLVDAGWTATLEEQLAREAEMVTAIARSDDAREGIGAFVEKRVPRFTGA